MEFDIDILAITETWLQSDCDEYVSRDVTPTNCVFRHVDRRSRGGGAGLLCKKVFAFKPKPWNPFQSFLIIDMTMIKPTPLRVIVIYRPPPSTTNGLYHELFFNEFASFLEQINSNPGWVLIVGDFHFQVDANHNSNTIKFLDLINIFCLKQHVSVTTR